MNFARLQDTRGLIIFEDHLLRYIILFFKRAAHCASRLDYEGKFIAIDRRISCSKSTQLRYRNISSLGGLIWHFIIDVKLVVGLRSISRLPGLKEFCRALQFHPWLRDQWEPIILSCTCESWNTWIEKGPCRPDITILKIATEHWEWSCFRHYRDRFRHWAFQKHPCASCVDKLHQMARNVEYDRIEVALRNYNPTIAFLNCISGTFRRTGTNIASLEPFLMVLRQTKNTRWLAWWAPYIHMQTGFTVAEICRTYIQSSWERDEIEGRVSAPSRIAGTIFEHRDLQHVVENVRTERINLDSMIAHYRRRQNTGNEEAHVASLAVME